jgi:hypothetical protein
MGTLVLDDLVDDPRVPGPRTEAPGDSSRVPDDAGQAPPPATDPRDHQHADREHGRRRAR